MTRNQQVLASMGAISAIACAKAGPQPDPYRLQQAALAEAVADARARQRALEEAGQAGTAEHLVLCSKATRWSQAWRLNR